MAQRKRILQHLKRHRKITPLDALDLYGCFRLAARISELRDQGFKIKTVNVRRNGKNYAEYQLTSLQGK
tara:strand:+ start:458 stop:664 length:207 start_codon:yes stop_codon:yes gene_type:complete